MITVRSPAIEACRAASRTGTCVPKAGKPAMLGLSVLNVMNAFDIGD